MGRGGRRDALGAELADSRRRTGTRDGGRPLERHGQGRPRLDLTARRRKWGATNRWSDRESSHARRELGQGSGEAEKDRPLITGLAGVRVPSSVLPGTSVPVFFCPEGVGRRRGTFGNAGPVHLRCGLRMALDQHLPLRSPAFATTRGRPDTRVTALASPRRRHGVPRSPA